MIQGVGHIGIAVKDIEKAVAGFCHGLGLQKPEIRHLTERQMKVAVLNLGGFGIEFVQDDSPDGMLARAVRERGNTIHHFALVSDDIEGDSGALQQRGLALLYPKSRTGVRGKRINFITSGLIDNVPVEISEP